MASSLLRWWPQKFIFALVSLLAASCAHDPEHPSQIHHPPGYGPQHYSPLRTAQKEASTNMMPRHRFENAEDWAKVFDDPERNAWQKPQEVVTKMNIKKGMTVVDLGAGTGYFLSYLNEAVGAKGKVLALDVEANLVGYMQERVSREQLKVTECRLIATDDPKLGSESVDRVLIVDTWHHIQERLAYAQKLKRALRKGGEIFVVDFEPKAGGPGPAPEHRLAPLEIEKEFKSAGFQVDLVPEGLPYQYIVRARRP